MWNTTSGARRTRFARAAYRNRWRTAWLSACSAALLAGCGGAGREAIPPPTAEALAAQSDRVAAALAAGDACGADELADELLVEAETAPLPEAYRAPLLDAARSLAAQTECPPPPPVENQEKEKDDKDEEKDEDKDEDRDEGGNGKGNGKGKGKRDKN